MENTEKFFMLLQPGFLELECVPIGGIDSKKEIVGKHKKFVFANSKGTELSCELDCTISFWS